MTAPDQGQYPCQHPRTPANTKMNGKVAKCRICRRVIEQRAQAKRREGNKHD